MFNIKLLAVFTSFFLYDFVFGFPRNLAWTGGPLHAECDGGKTLMLHREHVQENVIAVKAVTFNDGVYLLTPRLKRGVLSTLWLVVRGRRGVELLPFPDQQTHTRGDCRYIQNAVDFFLDYLGNLWVLDSGIVESMERPLCTCRPKVVVLSILLKKMTKVVDLSPLVDHTSTLQSIAVEYGLGGTFIYISDASRGAILIHDTSTGKQWISRICEPTSGLQIASLKRGLSHVLVIIRMHDTRILEVDTATLKKDSGIVIRAYYAGPKPLVILGVGPHHIFVRHATCSDVLSWDIRQPYNASNLLSVHSAGPRLIPTSVATDPLKPVILVLDSNFADTVLTNTATYHRITFVGQ